MKKTTLILVLMVLVVGSISQALIEKSPFWNLIGEWLTYSGNVKIEGNVSIDGNYVNITVVNYNVTGDFAVDGNVSADYFLGNGSLMNSNIWNETAGKVYCANDNCNVGIGTDTPSQKLDVGGSAVFGSSPGAANDFIINPDYAGSGDLLVGTYIGGGSNAGNLNIIPTATGAEGTILSLGYYTGAVWESALQISNTAGGVFGNLTLMKDGGNVGIGTTSPKQKLDVREGAVWIGYSTGSLIQLIPSSTGTNGATIATSYLGGGHGPLKFSVGGSERVRIATDGDVGIGNVSSAGYKLRLYEPTDQAALKLETGGSQLVTVHFVSNGTQKSIIGYNDDDATFSISHAEAGTTLADTQLVLKEGMLGLGIDKPVANLHIYDDTNSFLQKLQVGDSSAVWTQYNNSGNQWALGMRGGVADIGKFTFYDYQLKDYVLTIQNGTGNIGIGTNTPALLSGGTDRILEIQGTVNPGLVMHNTDASNQWFLYHDDIGRFNIYDAEDSLNRLVIDATGNVGIGTTTPKNNLQIADTVQLFETGSGAPSVLNLGRNIYNDGAWKRIIADNDAQLYQQPADTTFRWYQATDANVAADSAVTLTERMRIDAGGYVGIGVTAPDEKLHVYDATEDTRIEVGSGNNNARVVINAGTASKFSILNLQHEGIDYWNVGSDGENDQNFYIYSFNKTGGGDRVLSIDNEGYTGIGTTLPSHKLNVVGSANVTDRIFANLSHVFGLATKVHTVDVANTWYNITMNRTHADSTGFPLSDDNVTIIIPHGGHYSITFGMGVLDTAVSPSAHVAMRVVANEVEIEGSYIEVDTATQGSDYWMERTTHSVELAGGDEIRLQYISADTSVTIDQHDTWATTPFVASGYIQEIISDLE